MAKFPGRPFLPRDFSPTGGGIDFLGMRWVNLTLLTEHLIPGINNATSDFGTYCLASWIPWKFRRLCTDRADFRLSKYRAYQEAVEVMMSHAMRTASPASTKYGEMNRRIGAQQKLALPCTPSFAAAQRKRSNSIFAAPLYGPSLRFLGIVEGDAIAQDGTSTEIPVTSTDTETTILTEAVEASLSASPAYAVLNGLDVPVVTVADIDDLGTHGLYPAYHRKSSKTVKRAFIAKLLPTGNNNGRTLTAQLMISTLNQCSGLNLETIRAAWHTGRLPTGEELRLSSLPLETHREKWAIFQARQYQRYIVEMFMWCFESALSERISLIDGIVDHALSAFRSNSEFPRSIREAVTIESQSVTTATEPNTISEHWNRSVHGAHPAYIWVLRRSEMEHCERAIRMLARWWIRTTQWLQWERHRDIFLLGGEDRISVRWFHNWVSARLDRPIAEFIKEIFEQLVFSQHIRVALSRFDGESQRLRFVLGDAGIIPTRSALEKGLPGNELPGWTADRLWAFTKLLCDLSIVVEDDDGNLSLGDLAEEVSRAN